MDGRSGSDDGGFVRCSNEETAVIRDASPHPLSRLGVAVGVEAIRMIERRVAGPRALDRAIELGYDQPRGPIERIDLVGLDVYLDVLEEFHAEGDERFRPPSLLERKVRAGELGRKTGEGFYVWERGERIAGTSDHPGIRWERDDGETGERTDDDHQR